MCNGVGAAVAGSLRVDKQDDDVCGVVVVVAYALCSIVARAGATY